MINIWSVFALRTKKPPKVAWTGPAFIYQSLWASCLLFHCKTPSYEYITHGKTLTIHNMSQLSWKIWEWLWKHTPVTHESPSFLFYLGNPCKCVMQCLAEDMWSICIWTNCSLKACDHEKPPLSKDQTYSLILHQIFHSKWEFPWPQWELY